jgi:acyl-coenzyme A synthetase/AMP-(fatty) acid ligase
MTDEVMIKAPELNDEKPQTVAAAIIVYYLYRDGYTIDKDRYNSIFGRSDMTINKIKKKVSDAYNS